VAVPLDKAYSFYYPENLESLRFAGADVVHFKPTEGDPLPDADAYYLGGGYPEVYAERISGNRDFLDGLLSASREGKLIYGECGGLMTLCRSIHDGEEEHRMAGVFDCGSELTQDRQGLSYVRAKGTAENILFPDQDILAHEFHYSRLFPTPSGPFAYDVTRGTGIDGRHDGLISARAIGSYMHQHALATRNWGTRFVQTASG